MAQRVPLTNDARQTFTTVVESLKVRFFIYYLQDDFDVSNSGWFCTLVLISSTPKIIVTGWRLNAGSTIGQNLITDLSGQFRVVPLTTPKQDLTSNNPWGSTHELIYFTAQEIASVQNVEAV